MKTVTTSPAKDTRMITSIPFDGFYESYSSEHLERILGISDDDYYQWDQDNPQKKGETDAEYNNRKDAHFDAIRDETDYTELQNEYAKAYVDAFMEDNGIKLEFEKLESPRYYNFSTDRIFCYIEPDEVKRLVSIVDRKKLSELVKEKFTSRDGFSSFYSNDMKEWNIDAYLELDHNQIETIIECVTAEHIAEENENYPYIATLMEDFYR